MLRFSIAQLRIGSFSATPVIGKARGWSPHPKVNCYSASSEQSSKKLLFRQLFDSESSTYTYLLADVSLPDKPALVRICFLKLFWSLISWKSSTMPIRFCNPYNSNVEFRFNVIKLFFPHSAVFLQIFIVHLLLVIRESV